MREKFRDLWDMMGYYQYLKFVTEGCSTILPRDDIVKKDRYATLVSLAKREEKLCFISDIEMFVKEYYNQQQGYSPIPYDCLMEIFFFTFAPDVWLTMAFPYKAKLPGEWLDFKNKFCTLGQLAKRFKKRIANKERLPRRLSHRQHLGDICSDMRRKAETYYKGIGFLD